jgi:hypothetical protein
MASASTESRRLIMLNDESAGEFLTLSMCGDDGEVYIEPASWPALRAAINQMIGECRE